MPTLENYLVGTLQVSKLTIEHAAHQAKVHGNFTVHDEYQKVVRIIQAAIDKAQEKKNV